METRYRTDAELRTLADNPEHLSQLKTLDLSGTNISDSGLEALASQAEHLSQLQTLGLSGTSISDMGLEALASQAQYLSQLQTLGLWDTNIGDRGFEALTSQAQYLSQLQTLDLTGTSISDRGLEALASQAQYLSQLQSLHLAGTSISDRGLKALASQAQYLSQLQTLDLWDTNIGDRGFEALASQAQYLSQLQSLDLMGTSISDRGLEALASQAQYLSQLQTLDLTGTRISNRGLEALASQAQYLSQMKSLDLAYTKISDRSLKALASQARHLSQLKSLGLSSTKISDRGLEALTSQAQYLSQLHTLGLMGTSISDRGLEALASQAQYLSQLHTLGLSSTKISDRGLEALASQARYLSQLTSLDLSNTKIRDRGVQALAFQAQHLSRLDKLDLRSTQTSLPNEIRDSGSANTIFEFISTGDQPIGEVKILIVGQGRVGKTHVRRRLFERDASGGFDYCDPASESTHDIDMLEIALNAKDNLIKGRVWDFGGQNYLHGTHRFFLSAQRSIYILVLDATRPPNGDGEDTNRIGYWLRMLAHHGKDPLGKAPVIVLVSQCDNVTAANQDNYMAVRNTLEHAKEADWYGANVFAVVDGFGFGVGIDLLDGAESERIRTRHHDAAKAVLSAIEDLAASVPGANIRFPSEFFALRERATHILESTPYFNFRTHSDFVNACEAIRDETQQQYLHILHNQGVVHWVGKIPEVEADTNSEMQETVFDPRWVKGPVYDLLNWPEHKAGWISQELLNQRLAAPSRPNERAEKLYRRYAFEVRDRNRIVSLMLACQIAFRIEKRQDLPDGILVPDRLPALETHELAHEVGCWTGNDVDSHRIDFGYLSERLVFRLIALRYADIKMRQLQCHRNRLIFTVEDTLEAGTCELLVLPTLSPLGTEAPCLKILARGSSDSFRRDALREMIRDIKKLQEAEGLRLAKPPDELSAAQITRLRSETFSLSDVPALPANPATSALWIDASKQELGVKPESLQQERSRASEKSDDLSVGRDKRKRIWRRDADGLYWYLRVSIKGLGD